MMSFYLQKLRVLTIGGLYEKDHFIYRIINGFLSIC